MEAAPTGGQNMIPNIITSTVPVRSVQAPKRPPGTVAIRIAMILALLIFLRIEYLIQSTVGRDAQNRGLTISRFDKFLPDIFFLVPFLVAFFLLSWERNGVIVSCGAGIALALFSAALLASVGMALQVFVWAGLSRDPLLGEALLWAVVFIPVSLSIVVFAAGHRQSSPAFPVGIVITFIYLAIGFPKIQLREFRAGQKQEQARVARVQGSMNTYRVAQHAVSVLTGCLIEFWAGNASDEFPAALDDLPRDLKLPQGAACDPAIARPGAVSNYTFTYTPERDASGKRINFRLLAMPQQKVLGMDPIVGDGRGLVFTYTGWAAEPGPNYSPGIIESPNDFNASELFGFRTSVRTFMQNNGGTPPKSFATMSWEPWAGNATDDPNVRRLGVYEIRYIPPTSQDPTRYAVTSTCKSYGEGCLRSFLLNYDGEPHQTSEPRAAMPKDPLIPDCDKYAQTCRDIDWPMPELESQ
jgi:hypothetical protein